MMENFQTASIVRPRTGPDLNTDARAEWDGRGGIEERWHTGVIVTTDSVTLNSVRTRHDTPSSGLVTWLSPGEATHIARHASGGTAGFGSVSIGSAEQPPYIQPAQHRWTEESQ